MAKFQLYFGETRTRDRTIAIEVEANDKFEAAEMAEAEYHRGKYDQELAKAEEETQLCDFRVWLNVDGYNEEILL